MSYKASLEIPIIALTANSYQEDIRKCLDAGMNIHLSKPIEIKKTAPTVFLKKDTDLERFYFLFTENHEFSNRLFFDGIYRILYCFFGI